MTHDRAVLCCTLYTISRAFDYAVVETGGPRVLGAGSVSAGAASAGALGRPGGRPAARAARAPPGVEPAAQLVSTRGTLPGLDIVRIDRWTRSFFSAGPETADACGSRGGRAAERCLDADAAALLPNPRRVAVLWAGRHDDRLWRRSYDEARHRVRATQSNRSPKASADARQPVQSE